MGHILSVGHIAKEPVGEPVKHIVVTFQEFSEGVPLTVRGPLGQIEITRVHRFASLDEWGGHFLCEEAGAQTKFSLSKEFHSPRASGNRRKLELDPEASQLRIAQNDAAAIHASGFGDN